MPPKFDDPLSPPDVTVVILYRMGFPVAFLAMAVFVGLSRLGGIDIDFDYFETETIPNCEFAIWLRDMRRKIRNQDEQFDL